MKKYSFVRNILSDSPGWEMDYYKSDDLNGSWVTERSCMIAVLETACAYERDVLDLLDDYGLDILLIENNIYCQFIDE